MHEQFYVQLIIICNTIPIHLHMITCMHVHVHIFFCLLLAADATSLMMTYV